MKKLFILIIVCSNLLFAQSDKHNLFTDILNKYIINGYVNYDEMVKDKRLNNYLTQLKQIDPSKISDKNERLAFWINAYNAFTLEVIIKNYPLESINDLHTGGFLIGHILGKTVWHKEWIEVGNKKLSLNNIEHDIIRKEFNEPRIHFALVCAAVSCPPLRFEAFEGYKLNQQLDDQAKTFLNDKTKNQFDIKSKTAKLSKILDWYDSDFGRNDAEVLSYISKFLQNDIAKNIKENANDWDIDYMSYNWNLNDPKNIK